MKVWISKDTAKALKRGQSLKAGIYADLSLTTERELVEITIPEIAEPPKPWEGEVWVCSHQFCAANANPTNCTLWIKRNCRKIRAHIDELTAEIERMKHHEDERTD